MSTKEVVTIGVFFCLGGFVSFQAGSMEGHTKVREEAQKDTCGCGEQRSCPFGLGIIGTQYCTFSHDWSRCEPDPRYFVPPPLPVGP